MSELQIIRRNELAKLLQVSEVTLWRWEKNGDMPNKIQIGERAVGWLKSDIEQWLVLKKKARKKSKFKFVIHWAPISINITGQDIEKKVYDNKKELVKWIYSLQENYLGATREVRTRFNYVSETYFIMVVHEVPDYSLITNSFDHIRETIKEGKLEFDQSNEINYMIYEFENKREALEYLSLYFE